MAYARIAPPDHLKKYVQYFWQGEIELSQNKSFTHISTASSFSGLLFYFDGGFSSSKNSSFTSFEKTAVFHGQTNNATDYITSENAGIFGVQFHPYVVPALMQFSSIELTNQMVTLDLLFGNQGAEIAEKVFFANDVSERVAIVTQFLEQKLNLETNKQDAIIYTVNKINFYKGNILPEDLAKEIHVSQRQYERRFKDIVGFSPKSYAKIVRFENALDCFLKNPKSLTDVAIECGYYDQAHFNHDFKTLSGYTPKAYYQNYLETTLL